HTARKPLIMYMVLNCPVVAPHYGETLFGKIGKPTSHVIRDYSSFSGQMCPFVDMDNFCTIKAPRVKNFESMQYKVCWNAYPDTPASGMPKVIPPSALPMPEQFW
ncbi:MAG: hypothetical protein O7C61_05055, partial [SAR324 cluster bacterium]|nr:hypothetical protein [SAR324 cluster bacterium]